VQRQLEAGEVLFEQYLVEHGLDVPPHEPDLGVGKRPDYVIERDGHRCVCEVKEFSRDASSLPRTVGYSSSGMDLMLKPIRPQIRQAAPQLKPVAALGLPLVVVIANPHGATVFTDANHVICAMYGDLAVRMRIDRSTGAAVGEPRWIADRNGKLTNDHPYISAVAMLRQYQAGGLGIDVFKAASPSATPVPGVFFDGPCDRVYEYDPATEAFVQVRGPAVNTGRK
jgi:hypothetical protein